MIAKWDQDEKPDKALALAIHNGVFSYSDAEKVDREYLMLWAEEVLARLDSKTASAMMMHFGLDGEEPMTYQQIADALGFKSKNGPHWLIQKALRSMRGGTFRAERQRLKEYELIRGWI